MGRTFISSARFRRAYRRLDESRQGLVDRALGHLGEALETGQSPLGLGLRKLAPGIYEVRAGLVVRIVTVEEGSKLILALLGDHDEVRRYLRRQ